MAARKGARTTPQKPAAETAPPETVPADPQGAPEQPPAAAAPPEAATPPPEGGSGSAEHAAPAPTAENGGDGEPSAAAPAPTYVVTAAAVVLRTAAGSDQYLYRGAPVVESAFEAASIAHAREVDLIGPIE